MPSQIRNLNFKGCHKLKKLVIADDVAIKGDIDLSDTNITDKNSIHTNYKTLPDGITATPDILKNRLKLKKTEMGTDPIIWPDEISETHLTDFEKEVIAKCQEVGNDIITSEWVKVKQTYRELIDLERRGDQVKNGIVKDYHYFIHHVGDKIIKLWEKSVEDQTKLNLAIESKEKLLRIYRNSSFLELNISYEKKISSGLYLSLDEAKQFINQHYRQSNIKLFVNIIQADTEKTINIDDLLRTNQKFDFALVVLSGNFKKINAPQVLSEVGMPIVEPLRRTNFDIKTVKKAILHDYHDDNRMASIDYCLAVPNANQIKIFSSFNSSFYRTTVMPNPFQLNEPVFLGASETQNGEKWLNDFLGYNLVGFVVTQEASDKVGKTKMDDYKKKLYDNSRAWKLNIRRPRDYEFVRLNGGSKFPETGRLANLIMPSLTRTNEPYYIRIKGNFEIT